ncbi:cupredoxin domain-containing protein [Conexibacter sp. SYSU D00693]|uniref:cupredoxin domain-containing protein n=1 Tax=Conexibacter sp. SYSU D00693 TaxID=2812560 RepID=UPI00196B2919|nr:cupredoxin domain-containing protein [Conexibacter sp. SYSU D00693]
MARRQTICATALAALVAAGAASGAFAAAKPKDVTVGSGWYGPGKVTLKAGEKVRWTWDTNGFELHDVSVKSGPERFKSPLQANGTYQRTLKKPGTYKLVCTQHGDMTMSLVVKKRR